MSGTFDTSQIKLRNAGKLATTTVTNELAAALNNRSSPYTLGDGRPDDADAWSFEGIIWDQGPNGEADSTNEGYWVKVQYVKSGETTDPIDTDDDKYAGVTKDDATNPGVVFATSMSERKYLSPGEGTHTFSKGTSVRVYALVDTGDPPKIRYAFWSGAPASPLLMLTGTSGLGAGCYACTLISPYSQDIDTSGTGINGQFTSTSAATVAAVAMNLLEIGAPANNHDIDTTAADVYFPGQYWKTNTNGGSVDIYLFRGFQVACRPT